MKTWMPLTPYTVIQLSEEETNLQSTLADRQNRLAHVYVLPAKPVTNAENKKSKAITEGSLTPHQHNLSRSFAQTAENFIFSRLNLIFRA
jgi:hypothetical protein